ncbi:PXDN [Mytilus coruscus]|uniref:PXDN n=1 Tax=Mytilus coruscus TaxID=42192 RepID=A0A6J8C5N5_MYTCO|nr:PXDN [Mytilus coruscus]
MSTGKSLPRGFPKRLPDQRLVSNVASDPALGPCNQFDKIRTGQNMAFGQRLTHDFIETDISSAFLCLLLYSADVCFPLDISYGDKRFPAGCKNFIRAKPAKEDPYLPLQRTLRILEMLMNSILLTAEITYTVQFQEENSFAYYGQNFEIRNLVRNFVRGHNTAKDYLIMLGDRRNDESPNLGLNHLLFVREHNRLSIKLHELNPCWSNEKVFQETRRIIIAQVQHITYNHFLPLVVNHDTMRRFNLSSKTNGFDHVYDDSVDASCLNSFGVAPWR